MVIVLYEFVYIGNVSPTGTTNKQKKREQKIYRDFVGENGGKTWIRLTENRIFVI